VQPVPKDKLARIPSRGKKAEPAARLAVVPLPAVDSNGLSPAPAVPAQP
jgi:hypothetical protein